MELKDKDMPVKPRKFNISTVLYVAATVVAIIGVALLIDNIYIFKSTVDQYVTQGYPAADVMKSMIPSQLLPAIFESIGLYGGIALILLCFGLENKKNSECLTTSKVQESNVVAEELIVEQYSDDLESTETTSELAETEEEIKN